MNIPCHPATTLLFHVIRPDIGCYARKLPAPPGTRPRAEGTYHGDSDLQLERINAPLQRFGEGFL